ncbi:DHH family phosphoesterase [Muriicola sp.]|uniref:DHH family phosphoesterase n=1 Tax=Muriicola sp. TaxID=2020856 RepID=UPI003C7394AD
MKSADVGSLKTLLSSPQKIVIIPHKNPDGDAIGAALALNFYLQATGHSSVVIAPNDYPQFLKWMPGTNEVINFEKHNDTAVKSLETATVIFTVDFNELSRIGHMEEAVKNASATFVMVDHHHSPAAYASIMYSDVTMSSTCEMIFHMIAALGGIELISEDMANCLYAGIVTDTGSFKYASTTGKTHRVVATLIDKGAQNSEIHKNIFDTNTASRLHLLGCALKNMVILPEFRTAYITLSQEELDTHQFKKGDTEGFVNYGLTLESIRFAVIFIENKEERIIKISFRSEGNFSVNEFARSYFEGGGHTNAAGGKSNKSMEETVHYFRSLLEQHKNALLA